MFYHGSSTINNIKHMLLPPDETNVISEKGRKKNLDKVFFTKDLKSAMIYAKRAVRQLGGEPILYRVIPMSDVECINETEGTTVYCCEWAFVEKI